MKRMHTKACNCDILSRVASLKEHMATSKHVKNMKGFSATPQEALKIAQHGKVLYIMCNELKELPNLSHNLNVNRHYMKMISFLYVKTVDSLLESLASLPYWQNVPIAIFLDELNQFCNNNNIQKACGIVAFLIDTAKACSSSLKQECSVCISVDKETVGDEYCNILNDLYSTEV